MATHISWSIQIFVCASWAEAEDRTCAAIIIATCWGKGSSRPAGQLSIKTGNFSAQNPAESGAYVTSGPDGMHGGQYKVAHILYPYVSIKRAYKIYLTPHKSSPIKSSLFWLKDRKVPFKWIESGRYINIYNKCLYEESSQPYYKEMHKREVLSSQNASVCVPLKIK